MGSLSFESRHTFMNKIINAEMRTATAEPVNRAGASLTPRQRTTTVRGGRYDGAELSCGSGNKIARGVVLTLGGKDKLQRFEQAMMPHMNAAYNLARWLKPKEKEAQDGVPKAHFRAF